MKRILINATQAEELRVAMVDGQLIYDLDIEVPSREQKKSNIYKGIITRVEPSLEAAFVNYGAERHGFLPFKEISRDYFSEDAKAEDGRVSIKDAIKVDQEIIVQVEKEERGNKGAALTSFVSLAGRFLVAMPQNPRAGGVSRRIEGDDRDEVRKIMSELNMPKGMGVIARTAGVGRSTEEMQWDLDYLNQLWDAIVNASKEKPAPFLIYQESDIVIRALRDHYKNEIGEILIDSKSAFTRAHEFMSMVMPNALHKLKYYDDKQPLFNRFQIENQIESAFSRTVNLPSGGAIVIDPTEALTSIDINSARATKGGDIEETALNTNLEAADEIARQLRIRDLGGLLVIDFIDMMKNKNQRDVEQRLRRAVYEDRARVQIGRISRFGLLEMSRQRLRPSLGESSQIVCPRCQGQGTIRDIESLSLSVLRLLEEEALKENTGRILTKLPVECATYLLNEKRSKITDIEDRCKVHCVIVPDPNLETPHFSIERVREVDTQRHESSYKSSYELASEDIPVYTPETRAHASAPAQIAAVQQVTPPAHKPRPEPVAVEPAKQPGLISKVFSALFGGAKKVEQDQPEEQNKANRTRRGGSNTNNRNRPPRNASAGENPQNRTRGGRNSNRTPAPKKARETDTETSVNQTDVNNAASQQDTEESRSQSSKSRNNNRNRNRNRNSNRRQNSENTGEQNSNDGNRQDAAPVAQSDSSTQPEPRERKPSSNPTRRRNSGPRRNTGDNAASAENENKVDANPQGSTQSPSDSSETRTSQPDNKAQTATPAMATNRHENRPENAAPAKVEARPESQSEAKVTTEPRPVQTPAPVSESATQSKPAAPQAPRPEVISENRTIAPAPAPAPVTAQAPAPVQVPAQAPAPVQAPVQAPAPVQAQAPKPEVKEQQPAPQATVTPARMDPQPQVVPAAVARPEPQPAAKVEPTVVAKPVERPVASEVKPAVSAPTEDKQPKNSTNQDNPPAA